jgi:hypothetical protein
MNAEQNRLEQTAKGKERWDLWGPYLAERAWGTVREDYSADGEAWHYFPHEHARSRVYRWSEDGIGGISDDKQRLCFAFAFWNERDPILKERFFGLTGPQGNHGEDVKEIYFYTDNTPSHSFMQMVWSIVTRKRVFPRRNCLRLRAHSHDTIARLNFGTRTRSNRAFSILKSNMPRRARAMS